MMYITLNLPQFCKVSSLISILKLCGHVIKNIGDDSRGRGTCPLIFQKSLDFDFSHSNLFENGAMSPNLANKSGPMIKTLVLSAMVVSVFLSLIFYGLSVNCLPAVLSSLVLMWTVSKQ